MLISALSFSPGCNAARGALTAACSTALSGQSDQNKYFVRSCGRQEFEAPAVTNAATAEALDRMLVGSGLTYRFIDARTVTLIPADASFARKTSATAPRSSFRSHHSGCNRESFLFASGRTRASAVSGHGLPNELEEIVVTATKRQERIQDIPLSISVVTASEISLCGLVRAIRN